MDQLSAPGCDPWLGFAPAEHGVGCVLRVQVGIADEWQTVLLWAGVLVLVALGGLLMASLVRR